MTDESFRASVKGNKAKVQPSNKVVVSVKRH